MNLAISTLGLHRAWPTSRVFGRERLTWWDYHTCRQVDVVCGCYMLVRHDALPQVGGFDESYFMYGEEMDWCWRFKNAGWQVWYTPDATIIHYGGMSSAQNPIEMQLHALRSYLLFIRKKQGRIAELLARLLIRINGSLRIGYWLVRWAIDGNRQRIFNLQKLKQSYAAACSR